jgi:hypothetical protein
VAAAVAGLTAHPALRALLNGFDALRPSSAAGRGVGDQATGTGTGRLVSDLVEGVQGLPGGLGGVLDALGTAAGATVAAARAEAQAGEARRLLWAVLRQFFRGAARLHGAARALAAVAPPRDAWGSAAARIQGAWLAARLRRAEAGLLQRGGAGAGCAGDGAAGATLDGSQAYALRVEHALRVLALVTDRYARAAERLRVGSAAGGQRAQPLQLSRAARPRWPGTGAGERLELEAAVGALGRLDPAGMPEDVLCVLAEVGSRMGIVEILLEKG